MDDIKKQNLNKITDELNATKTDLEIIKEDLKTQLRGDITSYMIDIKEEALFLLRKEIHHEIELKNWELIENRIFSAVKKMIKRSMYLTLFLQTAIILVIISIITMMFRY